jgi:hypothetical protein
MQLIYEVVPSAELCRSVSGIQNRPLYSFREDAISERETKAAGVDTDQTEGTGGPCYRTDRPTIRNFQLLNSEGGT